MGQAGRWGINPPVGPMKASGVARPRRCDPRVLHPCLFGLVRAPNAARWAVSGKARDAWCKSSPMAPGWVRLCVPGSKGPRLSSYVGGSCGVTVDWCLTA